MGSRGDRGEGGLDGITEARKAAEQGKDGNDRPVIAEPDVTDHLRGEADEDSADHEEQRTPRRHVDRKRLGG